MAYELLNIPKYRLTALSANILYLDVDVGKRPVDIVRDLGCGRTLVHKVQTLKAQGKDLSSFKRDRKKTVLTPRVTAAVRRRIKAAPTKSLRRVAREAGLKREAVRQVVIQSGWKSLKRTKVPLISAEGRERRDKRAAGLVNVLKSKGRGTIFFVSAPSFCLLYTSPSPRDRQKSRMPSSA